MKKEIKQTLEKKLLSISCIHSQGMGVENVFRFVNGGRLKSRKIIESKYRFEHFCNDGWYLKKKILSKLKYVDLDWIVPYNKRIHYRKPENDDTTLFFENIKDDFNIESIFVGNHFPRRNYFDGSIYLLYDPESIRVFWYLWFD